MTPIAISADRDDTQLVERSLAGDRQAFGQIVARYQSLVCALAYSATGSRSQSEDLAQETFLAAWRKLRDLREPGRLCSWLCGIARNVIHGDHRRLGREPVHGAATLDTAVDLPSVESLPSAQAVSNEEMAILWREVGRLPEIYREPLILFYRDHKSVEHVAAALDLTSDAVMQRLTRGRRQLQERMLEFVESTQQRTNPGPQFTLQVQAAIPLLVGAGPAAAMASAAKGGAAAKGGLLGVHHPAGREGLNFRRSERPLIVRTKVRAGHCLARPLDCQPTTKTIVTMSSLRLRPALLLAVVSSGWAAGPAAPPELNGILVTGKDHRFALVGSGGGYFHWASLGETVDGWKLVDYISSDDSLVLNRDGQEVTVRLRASAVSQADAGSSIQATVATADEVLTKMKFEAMWDRIAGEQKKAIIGGMRQQATAEFSKMGLPQAEIDTLLEKMGDAVVAGLQSDAMRKDFARIFTEVYTKDELRGMADFYDTAAGKAWAEKQPEVQQKLMQAMMPRVMQGMPAAQKIAADYLRQRAAAAAPAQTRN